MNYNNSNIDPTINYTHYKNVIASHLDLFPSTVKNEYTDMKYIHEHLFEAYDPFLLAHSCSKNLLVKCVTCSDIFCNSCGKRIIPTLLS